MYIREYMKADVITLSPDKLVPDAEKGMRDYYIRRLPVVDRGKLVGLVTQKDLTELKPCKVASLNRWELDDLLTKTKVKEAMIKVKDLIYHGEQCQKETKGGT